MISGFNSGIHEFLNNYKPIDFENNFKSKPAPKFQIPNYSKFVNQFQKQILELGTKNLNEMIGDSPIDAMDSYGEEAGLYYRNKQKSNIQKKCVLPANIQSILKKRVETVLKERNWHDKWIKNTVDNTVNIEITQSIVSNYIKLLNNMRK